MEDLSHLTTQCVICGRDLPVDMTQLIIALGEDKFKSCCLQHEGSEKLKKYIKDNRTKQYKEETENNCTK